MSLYKLSKHSICPWWHGLIESPVNTAHVLRSISRLYHFPSLSNKFPSLSPLVFSCITANPPILSDGVAVPFVGFKWFALSMNLCDEKRPFGDSAFNSIMNFVFQGKAEFYGAFPCCFLFFVWNECNSRSTEEILVPWKTSLKLSSRLSCPVVGHVAWETTISILFIPL